MARIFKTPFGAQGDTEQVPEAPQGDGSVSLTQGFGYDYEREYEDPAAKDIRREVMNGLFHDVTEAIGDIQLSGVAKWDAAAAPYPAGAIVWHASAAWLSTVGNNTTTPSEGASWTAVATVDSVGNAYVPLTRTITAGTGLSGGGSLAANRTLSADFATTSEAQALESLTKLISPGRLGDAMNAHVLGMGQTWQNVTSQRTPGTTYTNTTGRTIFVSVSMAGYHVTAVTGLIVDSLPVGRFKNQSERVSGGTTGDQQISLYAVVPPGSEYRLQLGADHSITSWAELR